jgi:GT2 family glycosyltransferase
MVKRSVYDLVSGLNEDQLKIAFNDVDFCLRLREHGLLNVYTPYCEAYHHESVSRGVEDSSEKIARFNAEVAYMKMRHASILNSGDPYYNPNLTLDREDFSLRLANG